MSDEIIREVLADGKVSLTFISYLGGKYMFTARQVALLNVSIESQIAIMRRKWNAEKNPGIRSLLEAEVLELDELKVSVNDPKKVTK